MSIEHRGRWRASAVPAVALAVVIVMTACDRVRATPAHGTAHTRSPSDSAQMAAIKRSIDSVTDDVSRLARTGGAEMKTLLPAHERLVKEFLARNDAKMRSMHEKIDPDWLTVIDSVQTDLARMPSMSPDELKAYFPAYERRLMRIVACIDMRGM